MLILRKSSFNLFPAEIGELSHLRLLDLRDCRRLKSISPGVISSLSRLQELFLPLSTDDERGFQWNLEELKALSQLETLEMRVPPNSNLMELPQDFGSSFWAKLANFRISINWSNSNLMDYFHINWSNSNLMDYLDVNFSSKNTLKLKGVSLSGWAAVLLKRVERLCVEELVLYNVGRGSFPKLQLFEATACQGIIEFLSTVIDERSVSHLSVMTIYGCNLEYVLSPSMAKALPQLQTLEVEDCENLKSIVGGCQENDTEDVVIFHQLEKLKLARLPMLVSFYTDSREGCALFTRKVGLPKLRKLSLYSVDRVKEIWAGDNPPPPNSSIRHCHGFVRAIPPAILPSLHRLESLIIESCDSLREIVGSEAALGGGVASSGLPKLREIRLVALPKLENVFPVPSLTCQCLSSMEIRNCGRLINLFSSPSTALAFSPNLQELKIGECENMEEITEFLSMVIDERSVSHLSVMEIFRCNLEYILSPSMAKVLPQLQTLLVKGCENLKSIVGGCQENDTEEVVIFHRLEKLYLVRLPMLVSFYPDSREGCALFMRQVGLPKLRELRLRWVDRVKEIWAGDIPPPSDSSFCNLTQLDIIECHELVRAIPPAILPSLHRLVLLIIRHCNSLREIVGSEAALGGVASSGLPKLIIIHLFYLPKLENLFSVPLLTCQSLSSIEIEGCGRLINLFSSPSTAIAFAPNLQELHIEACEKMEEIVSGGSTGKDLVPGDRASSSPHRLQIIFPRLKHLRLSLLPNLTSHCPSGYLLGSESSLKIEHYFKVGCVTDEFELNSSNSSVQSEETLEAP